ncbi:MAG: 30S ribosomal protein S7 [Patescibacteria group bacterium]|nr:30S ribosomal protein S7 [Patescibacteria group bacterium]
MRSKRINRKEIEKDPIYQSELVTKLTNRVMTQGKKTIAQNHVYKAFEIIKEKTKKDPLEVFEKALENVKPQMEVRARRVGGAAYQVPMPVRGQRKETLAVRWIIKAAQARPNKTYHHFYEKLASEIMDASKKEGDAIKRKEDTQKMAEANKAFAHFRW